MEYAVEVFYKPRKVYVKLPHRYTLKEAEIVVNGYYPAWSPRIIRITTTEQIIWPKKKKK